MVADLIRLKWQLLRNSVKRSPWQIVGLVIGLLYGLFIVGTAVAGLIALRAWSDVEALRTGYVLAGALLVLGWVLLPLLAFGNDPTLDPARFATFAIPTRPFVIGMTLAALVGIPGVASALVMAATVVTWSRSVPAAAVGLIAAPIALFTMVVAGRLASTALARVMQSRRGRDLTVFVTLILAIGFGPIISVLTSGSFALGLARLRTVADVVAWTPLGWAFAAPADAAGGALGIALVRLVLAVAFLAGLLVLWGRALRAATENPFATVTERTTVRGDGLGWFGRLPATPTGAIAARMLTYWRRDPRFVSGALLTPFIPLFLLIPYFTTGRRDPTMLLAMAPFGCFLLGWSEHNNVAYDSTAFWSEVAAGVSGVADRLGRLVPSLVLFVPMAVGYSLLSASMTGRWALLPGLIGLSFGIGGAGYGMSMVMSAVKPYPVPSPGDSPFATPTGAVGITFAVQSIGSAIMLALASPLIVLAVLSLMGQDWAIWALLGLGLVLGPVYFLVGLRIGAARFDSRAPELLATLNVAR